MNLSWMILHLEGIDQGKYQEQNEFKNHEEMSKGMTVFKRQKLLTNLSIFVLPNDGTKWCE